MKWNEWEKKKQQQQSGMEGVRTPVNRVKWIDMGEIYSLSFSGRAAINNQTTPRTSVIERCYNINANVIYDQINNVKHVFGAC